MTSFLYSNEMVVVVVGVWGGGGVGGKRTFMFSEGCVCVCVRAC